MSYDYEDVDRPGNRPTGASIPLETSLAAWKSIAEERLAAVEMWKQKAADAEADALRLHGEKMAYYTAALELVHAETIKNVCGWYPQIEAFRKLLGLAANGDQQTEDGK